MSLTTQAKILRLLQEGKFERLGGHETITVDVRIVTATNQNLDSMIESGRFRRDLFYRLRGVTIHLPPLKDRPEDIPELSHHFLYRFNRQLGTSVHSISSEAIEILQRHSWPGNIRELQSVVREAMIVSAGATLLPEFLPIEVRQPQAAVPESETITIPMPESTWPALQSLAESAFRAGEQDIYRRALEQFDRVLLSKIMSLTNGNKFQASAALGLSRQTLRSKLRDFNLSVTKVLTSKDTTESGPSTL
jgi:two-component system nitrogen regulation response regulator GlnG